MKRTMKRILLAALTALTLIGGVTAQGWGGRRGSPAAATLQGTLQFQQGTIALATGKEVYYVPALERFVGFIEDLREGSQITLDGYISGDYVEPLKLTINGKSYDFSVAAKQRAARGGSGCRGYGPGRGWRCW